MNKIKAWLIAGLKEQLHVLQCVAHDSPVRNKEFGVGLGGELEIQVHDKDGKLVSHRKEPMHTFTRSFFTVLAQLLNTLCSATPKVNILGTDNATHLVALSTLSAAGDWCFAAVAAEDGYGVLVGTSSSAWGFNDYNLYGKIAHVATSGTLSYGACSVSSDPATGAPAKVTIQRSFDNNSGADITVREIGWFGIMKVGASTFMWHMIARDVITATTVPNGGRLTVTYNILVNPT